MLAVPLRIKQDGPYAPHMVSLPSATLNVTFANLRGDAAHVGPFPRLVFEGPQFKDRNNKTIAVHRDHRWQLINGTNYSRLECYSPCTVWFESPHDPSRKSRLAGPFSNLSFVDGTSYGDHRILAYCDEEHRDWYSFDFGQHYRCLVAVPYVTSPNSRSVNEVSLD
jgi:hypothetical protein